MSTPAGWYTDPGNPNRQRYWNGAAWTEHVGPEARSIGATPETDGMMGGAWAMAILLPIIGVILGIVIFGKGDQRGIAVVMVSLIVGGLYAALWFNLMQPT